MALFFCARLWRGSLLPPGREAAPKKGTAAQSSGSKLPRHRFFDRSKISLLFLARRSHRHFNRPNADRGKYRGHQHVCQATSVSTVCPQSPASRLLQVGHRVIFGGPICGEGACSRWVAKRPQKGDCCAVQREQAPSPPVFWSLENILTLLGPSLAPPLQSPER